MSHARITKDFVQVFAKKYPIDSLTNVSPRLLTLIGRNLYEQRNNPISLISKRINSYFVDPADRVKDPGIIRHKRYDDFKYESPVVTIHDNFDSLLVAGDHVSRRPCDTYYINESHLLRSHTSAHQMHCLHKGSRAFVCIADCFRRDEIDSSHFPCFHQCEVFRLFNANELGQISLYDQQSNLNDSNEKQAKYTLEATKSVEIQLKLTIEDFIRDLFDDPELQMRWVSAYFPFTHPSFELEILWRDKWMEILGCGVVRDEILQNAGLRDQIGFAAGFGLERLAMLKYKIDDIRLFWSDDKRFLYQFDNKSPFEPIVYKPIESFSMRTMDISFWLPSDVENFSPNDFYDLVRSIGDDLVEEVKLVDEFKNSKTRKTSNCFRIVYRSCDRVLSKDEVNEVHKEIGQKCIEKFGVELRA